MRRLVALLTVLASMVLAPSTASAVPSPYERTDAVGEVPYRKGDIHKVRVAFDADLRLSVFARGTMEADSTEWTNPAGRTHIVWRLMTDPGATVDYIVKLRSAAGGPTVRFTDGTGMVINSCDFVATFANAGRYTIRFDESCIGAPTSIRAKATFTYEPPGPPPPAADNTPGNGFTPLVERVV
jgi:hypothetical protein